MCLYTHTNMKNIMEYYKILDSPFAMKAAKEKQAQEVREY